MIRGNSSPYILYSFGYFIRELISRGCFILISLSVYLFIYFWQYWGLNSGLAFASQALSCLNHIPQPFSGFSFQVLSHVSYLGWPHTMILTPMASFVAGITDMHHCAWSTGWDGGLDNFLPMLASNFHFPDLCLSSGWDYRHEPLCPASWFLWYKFFKMLDTIYYILVHLMFIVFCKVNTKISIFQMRKPRSKKKKIIFSQHLSKDVRFIPRFFWVKNPCS
jgi:hypothetical protein